MAPTLRGIHRVCTCSRCGQEVAIGRHYADTKGSGDVRFYRKTFCPSCGLTPLDLSHTKEIRGDRVRANKAAYLVRSPARWEIVVLRLFGTYFIKRLLGLPGEDILIHDGDLYVNGELQRKTYAQAKRMRVRIFSPLPCTRGRGEGEGPGFLAVQTPSPPAPLPLSTGGEGRNTLLSFDTAKCEPLRDEYAYNAGQHADSECVHDFMVETEIEATGAGSLALRLCDGHDWVEVRLPVGIAQASEAKAWPLNEPEKARRLSASNDKRMHRPGQRYRVEMAFVDRRLTVMIDDQPWLEIDLPEAKVRDGVARPFQLHADGVQATMHSFRLYRDVHYGQQGNQAVHGKMVRLGVDQYFVLGDNSPHSEDSRHWPDEGRVPAASLIGPLIDSTASRAP